MNDNPMPYPCRADMRPAQWAQLHAGIEFILPIWERNCLILRSGGRSLSQLAVLFGKDEIEIERALGRVCRTLCTWERNASKWSTRYVAQEPQATSPEHWHGNVTDAQQPRRARQPLRAHSDLSGNRVK